MSAYRGSDAISPPTTIAVLPKTAVMLPANTIAVHGELIVFGNCNPTEIVTMTTHATERNMILMSGF
jgi:hypothetical protein